MASFVAACGTAGGQGTADSGSNGLDATQADAIGDATAPEVDDARAADSPDVLGTPFTDGDCNTLLIVPDAAPHTCVFTPADLACNLDSDCVIFVRVECSCIVPVYGVNTSSTAVCPAPPCPPPMNGCDAGGYLTQDCQVAPNYQDIGVRCVNHQCFSFSRVGGE
jgi:hypothetical protein